MADVNTVVKDVYHLLEDKKLDASDSNIHAVCREFGEECQRLLMEALCAPEQDRSRLRLSAIGKPDRMLWNAIHGVSGEPLKGPTYIKFLYGHLVEAMVLALVEAAGHSVTEQQKEVEVEGVKGHIDCYIDGRLIDVKSASNYGFKKFRNGTLHEDDPFGYVPQLRAYAHAEGQTKYGWLAMDKSTGHLAYLEYDEENPGDYKKAIDWDVPERVREVVKLVGQQEPPSVCYQDVPDGKSGNRKLDKGCTFCDFKHSCWPKLQRYEYSNGPKYLTHVEKEPRVVEVPDGF